MDRTFWSVVAGDRKRTVLIRRGEGEAAARFIPRSGSKQRRLALLAAFVALGGIGLVGPAAPAAAAATYLQGWGSAWGEYAGSSVEFSVRMSPTDLRYSQNMAYQFRVYDYGTGRWTEYGWSGLFWQASIFNTSSYVFDYVSFKPPRGTYHVQVRFAWLMTTGWKISNYEIPCVKSFWTTTCMNRFTIS